MAGNGKINFGLANLFIATYTEGTNGVGTLGTPLRIEGAKSITLEPQGDSNVEYADNMAYWSDYTDNGFSGTLTVEKFPDEFKEQFLGYKKTADGGLAQIKGATRKPAALIFEGEDDALKRRVLLVNVSLSGITREWKTTEDKVEASTESVEIRVTGDNYNGVTKVGYNKGDAGYETVFTKPVVPSLEVA